MINTVVLFSKLVSIIEQTCLDAPTREAAVEFFSGHAIKSRLLMAPASTAVRFHHAYDGGLLEHTLQVADYALKIAGQFNYVDWNKEDELRRMSALELKSAVVDKVYLTAVRGWYAVTPLRAWDIVIAALLHDIHKIGDADGQPNFTPNILKSGKRSDAIPYESSDTVNNFAARVTGPTPMETSAKMILARNLDFIPEGELSLALVAALSPKLFGTLRPEVLFAIRHHDGMYGLGRRELAGKETFLQQVLHTADMFSSRESRWLEDQKPADPSKLS